MSIFSSLFASKSEDPLKVKTAIVAYCYGNLTELAFANIEAFIGAFEENPTDALKARLYSAGLMREGLSINQKAIPEIEANIHQINLEHSILLFDFSYYGDVFKSEDGMQMIAPNYVAIVFNNDLVGEPIVFFLEPSFEPSSTVLIQALKNGSRLNLGMCTAIDKHTFIKIIIDKINKPFEDKIISNTTTSISVAEEVLNNEFGITLDKTPDRKPIEDLFTELGEGLSESAQISLLYRLVAFNFLATAKIMKDEGENVVAEEILWVTELVNRAVEYSENADDHIEAEKLTSRLNMSIVECFKYLGVKQG